MKSIAAAAGLALGALAACTGPRAGTDEARRSPPRTAPPPIGQVAQATAAAGPARLVTHGEATQGGWLRGTVPEGTRRLTLDGAAIELAPDGAFLIAFDRDAGPSATLVAELSDGRRAVTALAIAPRAWEIEHISTPMRPAAIPSAEFQRLRPLELARIAAARAAVTGSAGWRQSFIWPAKGRISGRFGSQRVYQGVPGSYHSGLDIAGSAGAEFVAPADGVVILAASAPFTLEGKLLMIDHGNGLNSAFLHSSELFVREGETVRQGQPIGRIGATGRATGPHLHWSLKWHEARLDPILFTGPAYRCETEGGPCRNF